MTNILKTDIVENAKWRAQANKISGVLKVRTLPQAGILKIGIAFDDAIVTIPLDTGLIAMSSARVLADHIYSLILTHAQTGGRA